VCSVVPEGEMKNGVLDVEVSPEILEELGINDGETIILESSVGELEFKVLETVGARNDTVRVERGGWMKYGKNVNVLTMDIMGEAGDGTPYYETMVRVRKE
ncbi:MAG: trimethylamine-N-oxide reductase, partial [Methanobacterium paludis]|nr:trimethylamine-N-oxide reductase [Methanobacterium paludis]